MEFDGAEERIFMNAKDAKEMIDSQMLTVAELKRIMDSGKSDDLSNTCSFFTKAEVHEMILLVLDGKKGVIKPGTTLAKYLLWGLVEFG